MPRVRLQGYASRTTTGWIVLGFFDGMLGGRAKGIFDGLPIPADKAVCYFLLLYNFCPCSSANGCFLLNNNNEERWHLITLLATVVAEMIITR